MSIEAFLNDVAANDKAVYWGNPQPDNYGGLTFDNPVEVDCFWMSKVRSIMSREGREEVSEAKVYVLQDVDQNGMLYHGELNDLTQAQKDDPKTLKDAYEILWFDKVPDIEDTGEFVRVARLGKTRG